MSLFMHKYIEQIVNLKGDSNCSYRAVSGLLGKGGDNHTFVRQQLLQELKAHRKLYTSLYRKQNILMQFTMLLFLVLVVPSGGKMVVLP